MGRKGTGVELRVNCIRVGFMLEGRWVRETLRIQPTPANEKYAAKLIAQVNDAIRFGRFSWAEYFPDSPRAQQEGPQSFGDAASLYLQSIGHRTEATRDQYRLAIDEWRNLLGAATQIKALTHAVLKAKIGSHPWSSAKRMNNALIPLRGVFDLIYSGPQAVHNPMIGVGNAAVIKQLPDPLSAAERDRILAEMCARYDERIAAYFTFAFFTGMRPQEIIALRWADVDLASGVIRVQRVRTFRGGQRDGSKTHTVRDVDLLPQAEQAIAIMKRHTFMQRAQRDGDADTSADIFQNPVTGQPWHDERSQRDHYWTPTLKRLGIRRRRAYSTRHTYATAALMGGVPPAYIAAQLGHSVQMLLSRYARWIPGADNGNARSQLAAVMSGNISPQFPREGEDAGTLLNTNNKVGRRDWTRTSLRGPRKQ